MNSSNKTTEKNVFLCSSRNSSSKSLEIIVRSAKKKEEGLINTELSLEVQGVRKITKLFASYRALILFLMGKLSGSKALTVSYRGIPIGKYAVSTSFRNYKSYQKKFLYYLLLIKNIAAGIARIESLQKTSDKVAACYVNDPTYLSGVYAEWSLKNEIPVYHNTYPYRLSRFYINKNKYFSEAFFVQPRGQYSPEMRKKGEDEIKKRIFCTESIEYMSDTSFTDGFDIKSDADALIYCHSFTDAQQHFGGDNTFLNMLEWLEYTVEKLKHKKIIIKAHPNFYKIGHKTKIFEYDKKIFEEFKKKLKNRENVLLIDWPVRNRDVLENLSKGCVLISHHGNALLEGGYLGFKCISSSAAPWKKYNLFNEWESLFEYEKLLTDFPKLIITDNVKLYEFMFDLSCSPNSFFNKKSWRVMAAQSIGVEPRLISKDSSILKDLSDSDLDELAGEIADEIGEVNL
jgi:hypothetical protein